MGILNSSISSAILKVKEMFFSLLNHRKLQKPFKKNQKKFLISKLNFLIKIIKIIKIINPKNDKEKYLLIVLGSPDREGDTLKLRSMLINR